MAANEYVQAAAAQLLNGATAIKSEIDQIRADFMNFERQVNRDISSRESEMRAQMAQAATGGEAAEIHAHGFQASRIKGEIEGLRKELEARRNQMNQAIRSKEGAMSDLTSQAQGLQNKAGSLK